jgi:hypothetical protein
VFCVVRAIVGKPTAFGVCHRIVAESVFAGEHRGFEVGFAARELLGRRFVGHALGPGLQFVQFAVCEMSASVDTFIP